MAEKHELDERVEERFGEIALEKGLVSEDALARCRQLWKARLEAGEAMRLGVILIQEGVITKAQALVILKEAHQSIGDHARIGGYELLDKLGEGAMGAVYRAKQLSMDRIVALKLLPRALSESKEARERFLREARIVARLNHPYIVRGFEVGEGNGYHFFAMEFVDGGTTGHRMRHEGPFSEGEAIQVGLEIAEALHHAHEAGIVHRDVKPDNIMMGQESFKLADLGLATQLEEDSSLTKTGDAVGTPYYMAPEQVEGWDTLDARVDIYALGASLYHLVTGQPPFAGNSAIAIMSQRLREDAPPACTIAKGVSRELTAILMRCMHRNRTERYPDCEALLEEFKRLQAGEKPAAYPLAAALPRKGRLRLPALDQLKGNAESLLQVCTPKRLMGTAAVMLLVTIVIWGIRNAEELRGPVHPGDPSIVWSVPPDLP
ncbi:MAG: serine/threonine-protein kinase, partial [Planctomycetota bacterium]